MFVSYDFACIPCFLLFLSSISSDTCNSTWSIIISPGHKSRNHDKGEVRHFLLVKARLEHIGLDEITILTMDSSPGPGARCPVIKKKKVSMSSSVWRKPVQEFQGINGRNLCFNFRKKLHQPARPQ
ncbi:hypothetical protein AVEN_52314-1 [Araneus ventricosus]|uniref:Secreted protein n=1 Tax=Araneus ventricosus TaxID=182803 RepID=A0A4Y2GKL5_ARAVE|nr:hypothetical protein AVEN_52314-1 [Araneus ventricosus]